MDDRLSDLFRADDDGEEEEEEEEESIGAPGNTSTTSESTELSEEAVHEHDSADERAVDHEEVTDVPLGSCAPQCDDHLLDRPCFTHHPTSLKRPHTLSHLHSSKTVQIPPTMNQYLRSYQREGVQFLYDKYTAGQGCILGDDMGLGKTIQAVAFMCAVLGKSCSKSDIVLSGPKPNSSKGIFLIICPSSLICNWVNEIKVWSHLKFGVYHLAKKSEVLEKAFKGRFEVVITTHDTAKTNIEELNSLPWTAVLVDEVHAIKNPQSQVATALNRLATKKRIGLTGTAVQNKLSELWCLLNWANPGCLGSLTDFLKEYQQPILEGKKFNCTKRQLATSSQKQRELESVIHKWILRRTKAIIAAQLPKKEEFVVFCPVTDLQFTIYKVIVESEDCQLLVRANEQCTCSSGLPRKKCCYKTNSEGQKLSSLYHEYLALLIKCSNHIGLLHASALTSPRQNTKAFKACLQAMSYHAEFQAMSTEASLLTLTNLSYSGKMQILVKLLTQFKQENDKVIIFSESVKLLNLLQEFLISRGYSYSRLDGSVKPEERAALVAEFNKDKTIFIFLISKKCGGVGLNVTGANRVIMFDPSWNPAIDQQAEDRAFRIGQSRDVKVYRLITEGTVEENMYLRQVYKQQLANTLLEGTKERRYFTGVAGDNDQHGELFGWKNILRLPDQGKSVMGDILERVETVDAGVRMIEDRLCYSDRDTHSNASLPTNQPMDSLLQGARVMVHSGRKAVLGNSKVEEHIRKQALLELEEHSQQPANQVRELMDLSEESEDITDNDESGEPEDPLVPMTTDIKSSSPQTNPSNVTLSTTTGQWRRQEFERIRSTLGHTSSYEFACLVVDMTTQERWHLLEQVYNTEAKKTSRRKRKGNQCDVLVKRKRPKLTSQKQKRKERIQYEMTPPKEQETSSSDVWNDEEEESMVEKEKLVEEIQEKEGDEEEGTVEGVSGNNDHHSEQTDVEATNINACIDDLFGDATAKSSKPFDPISQLFDL